MLAAAVGELNYVRGHCQGDVRGMMIGIDLTIPGTPAVAKCMERGVLINCTHDTVIRLLPALNITAAQVDEGAAAISDVLREMAAA